MLPLDPHTTLNFLAHGTVFELIQFMNSFGAKVQRGPTWFAFMLGRTLIHFQFEGLVAPPS
jgi:hypothetical protein